MQPGRAQSRTWVLEFEPSGRRTIEPLMGWTATDNPFAQIRLRFPTLATAVAYAERQGLDYRVIEPPARRRPRERYRETVRRLAAAGMTMRGSRMRVLRGTDARVSDGI
jgi:hypothetical protein